jgi:phage shock protein C
MDLKRATRDRWVLGVCGGIAHSMGWNPNVVRLVTALLAIFIPGPNVLVLVAYLVLGAVLPRSTEF